ncbi:putative cell cycle inhibitor [Plectosphaerella plurivora]|uniref:Cell cycle inhibitor n=1 Tax=Plectosphaerella plurivora TaxID=936078 RepID=A0A9P8VI48_9PEZI|nr:putative cell cycle inhibitor [Plectosphaerella plurivora]
MGLRDLLRKKEDIDRTGIAPDDSASSLRLQTPEFKFVRSDTHSQEIIHPPSAGPATHNDEASQFLDVSSAGGRSRSASVSSTASATPSTTSKARKRLSERLHLSRPRSSSEHVPQDLPDILPGVAGGEEQWEKRATMLAHRTDMVRSRPDTPESPGPTRGGFAGRPGIGSRAASTASGQVSTQEIDDDIQEAIRLHEEGDLERSTVLFGRLADPNGANNPLSQVLYGLALRHGWGCKPDVTRAVTYLTAAASNAAAVEQLALQAGLKKGGAAKGELVLAIFELGNSFRHGWGTEKDPYYETAANLGDTDAMNETGWCYLEGFGCKKDKTPSGIETGLALGSKTKTKPFLALPACLPPPRISPDRWPSHEADQMLQFTAARYYRLAETNGNKTLGNTWIWKEKYDPDAADKKSKKKK